MNSLDGKPKLTFICKSSEFSAKLALCRAMSLLHISNYDNDLCFVLLEASLHYLSTMKLASSSLFVSLLLFIFLEVRTLSDPFPSTTILAGNIPVVSMKRGVPTCITHLLSMAHTASGYFAVLIFPGMLLLMRMFRNGCTDFPSMHQCKLHVV